MIVCDLHTIASEMVHGDFRFLGMIILGPGRDNYISSLRASGTFEA